MASAPAKNAARNASARSAGIASRACGTPCSASQSHSAPGLAIGFGMSTSVRVTPLEAGLGEQGVEPVGGQRVAAAGPGAEVLRVQLVQPAEPADRLAFQRQRHRAARREHAVELGERRGRVVQDLHQEPGGDHVERAAGKSSRPASSWRAVIVGWSARSRATMPADASTAVTTQPRTSAARATAPRPAPTSSTRAPGAGAATSTSRRPTSAT